MYFLRLIRATNLSIIVFTMVAIRYGIIVPLLASLGLSPSMPIIDFWLMIAATIAIGAAGYVINDYFDQKIDAVNKPHRIVVGKQIHRREAILLHWIFNGLAFVIGVYLAYRVQLWWLVIVYLVVIYIFWSYSLSLKRRAILGNIAVATMAFLVPFQVMLFEFAWYLHINNSWPESNVLMHLFVYVIGIITIYSLFAFLTNFVREIIKDFEDVRGDVRYGRRSLPITLGPVKAKWIVQIVNALIIGSILILYFRFLMKQDQHYYYLLFLVITIIVPLIFVIYTTYKAREATMYSKPGNILKVVMLMGIIFCFVFGYL
ncbi:MAG: geranylgeranylglycerol-phosphate geranylgeranyltransferase [Salinivirgaceae bacterium]|nr:geranylgeranylglycerol-phosphate geranylgeranyltransferase [Salinivirgaceae bacterium]